jgi:hypothetical protein
LESAIQAAPSRRSCPEFPDEEFLEAGVGRALAQVRSSREWIQQLQMWMNRDLSVGNFFQALHSRRRLKLTGQVARDVCRQLDDRAAGGRDPLSSHKELQRFSVYASDGHYEEHAAHTKPVGGKQQPVGFFYSLNLRSHSLSLLDIARPEYKREHDITALKRLDPAILRMGQPKGVKVIHAYDRAVIDFRQWKEWKNRGIYILTRQKENMNPDKQGDRVWDRNDKRNKGVLADELIAGSSGILLRRVIYRDGLTGAEYSFITNEMTLPPGLIAFLYKMRWDIEKVFDEKKNKLLEKKAWACSETSRSMQAHFICLAHNLMVLFEECLDREEGIRDEKVSKKGERRMEKMLKQAGAALRGG